MHFLSFTFLLLFQSSFSKRGITKLPRIIYSGFSIFFLLDRAGAAVVCFCFCWLTAPELESAPIANKSFLSSVKNAVPFGLESLFNSDLNCEYCDSSNLFIFSACCRLRYAVLSGQSEVGWEFSPQI